MIAVLLGAGTGLGLLGIAAGLTRPKASLADALNRLHPADPAGHAQDAVRRPSVRRLVGLAAGVLAAHGMPTNRARRDAAVVGTDIHALLAQKLTAGLTALVAVPIAAGLLSLTGAEVGLAVPAWATLACAGAAFYTPDLRLRARAGRARADVRHALSAYLDLTVISLAAGAGINAALTDAATIGTGPAFTRIRTTLDQTRITRQPLWTALAELGTEIGVDELRELAATITLAGHDGAKVRETLAVKAASLRTHQLAEAEAKANAATERMSVPLVLLFAAFLAFIGYPAVITVLAGL